MSRKNKKKGQMKFPVPIPVVMLILVVASFALVYICLQSRTEKLGRDIKTLEVARDALKDQLEREQCEWAKIQAPYSIEQALKTHGLVMTWPGRDQIVRVRYNGSVDTPFGIELRQASRLARANRVVMND